MVPPMRATRTRARSRPMDADETDLAASGFSAGAERTRVARAYLFWVMPVILAIVTILTFIEWRTGNMPASLWIACAAFWVIVVTTVAIVHRGADPIRVAGASLLLYGVI